MGTKHGACGWGALLLSVGLCGAVAAGPVERPVTLSEAESLAVRHNRQIRLAEAALAQASAGVDVIFHIADAAGIGVVEGAVESDIWVIGWGADQNHLAPENVLSSSLTNSGGLLIKDVELAANGTWTGQAACFHTGRGRART